MANEILKRDQNRVTVLAGVTDDANMEIRMFRVDPITNRLKISATFTATLEDLSDVTITAPVNGQVLSYLNGVWVNSTAAGGGDVVGPASSTDNAIARFDATTGKLLQNSTVLIGDTGNVTGLGTLNTHTLPGGTSTIAILTNRLDQFAAPNTDLSINGNKLTNVATPSASTDAANKSYVDSVVQGLDTKESVVVATAAALPTCTYSNGSSGVGATLTASSVGVLTVDGVATVIGDRILVKDQVAGLQNGIYVVTVQGTAGVPFVLTRTTDADSSSELIGAFVFVESGSTNASNGWTCTNTSAITMGTTAISFAQFSGAGQITAGAGLTKTGNTIDAVGTANRITVNADSIDIAATYVGQTSITTVGTIATGTWQGTAIAGQYGGTGVANTGKTITLGGNFVISGAFDLTLTITAATNVTLPTTGTVATLAGAETFSNKRIGPRTASSTTSSNLSPNLATANVYFRTTQTATLTIDAPTGTPVIGEVIVIYVDSASAQTLTINATYIPFGASFPSATTAGKTFMMTAQYNGTNWKTLWANAV